jgi:hypothetical protein
VPGLHAGCERGGIGTAKSAGLDAPRIGSALADPDRAVTRGSMRVIALPIGILVSIALGYGTAHAQAQSYEPIRADSGLTGSYISKTGRGGGGALFEIKYLVHDQIAVGARAEAQVMFGGSFGGEQTKMDMAAVAAVLAKGEYYLTTSTVRPFIGLAFGVYDIGSQSITAGPMTAAIDQKAGRYFGVAPQLGVDFGRLRLAATYNKIVGADIEIHQQIGDVDHVDQFTQSYFAFEMAIRWGGERRQPTTP